MRGFAAYNLAFQKLEPHLQLYLEEWFGQNLDQKVVGAPWGQKVWAQDPFDTHFLGTPMCFVLKIGHFLGFPTPPFGNACHQHLGKAMNHLKFQHPSLFSTCPPVWQHPGAALAKQKGPPGDQQGRPCRPFSSKNFNLFKLQRCKSKIAI